MSEGGDSGAILMYKDKSPIGLSFADINFSKEYKV